MSEPVNGARDEPSSLEFEYEPMFGGTVTTKKGTYSFTIQNQNADGCPYGCTRYGLAHIVNCQNSRVAMETNSALAEIYGKDFWKEYLKTNPEAEFQGATLQSAMEQFKKSLHITGYARCNPIQDMKNALDSFRLIYTGSMDGDWGKVAREHVYGRVSRHGVGHVFCIVAYDSEGWIAVNSYGEDNGFFHIPFELTDTLFNRYAILDSSDEEKIASYRKRIMDGIKIEEAKRAYENKLWNGERPEEPITRQEAAAIIQRALDSLKK